MNTSYERLLALLDGVRHRVIDHPAEGRTDLASELRGHPLEQAAKSMVLEVRLGGAHGPGTGSVTGTDAGDGSRYVLAVVPGDRRVDYRRVRRLFGGSDARLAEQAVAERLSGCVSGCVIPFSFDDRLAVVLDSALLVHDEVYFNAARLDRSIALPTKHLLELGRPLVEDVSKPPRPA